MLIYLDNDLKNYLDTETIDKLDLLALERIAESFRDEHHFITGSPKTLDFIREIDVLSQLAKEVYTRCFHNSFSHSGYISKIHSKIIVKPSTETFTRTSNEISINQGPFTYVYDIFNCPLSLFSVQETLQKTRFVSEHINDVRFYEILANDFKINTPIPFKFERVHGGGNDTFDLMEEHILNNHLVLTIVDSDQKSPSSSLGTTATNVIDKFIKYKESSISGVETLKFHEKENLFSPSIYKIIGHNVNFDALNKLERISESDNIDGFFLKYFDFKEGLSFRNFHSDFDYILEIDGILSSVPLNDTHFYGTKEQFYAELNKYKSLDSTQKKNSNKIIIDKISNNPLGDFHKNLPQKLISLRETENELSTLQGARIAEHLGEVQEGLSVLENMINNLLVFQQFYIEILATKIREWGMYRPVSY